ncbi:hypothetical protein ONS95_013348 [Cadophora gregata]|uniref:uncharacterized protein n=1 Tax=Cadophora gregata TaxID=51156 RepID=UPI0026DB8BAB|nr:uncharacterized protein ONS95_013348 [Cadophora gregata]KAK0099759.1 hypothetical protein ONS96_008256 [Cadophora gregata f. sp. sojae]KAK0116327.1 hypothetical protein ONS95_013348 [Cadophora gregata]
MAANKTLDPSTCTSAPEAFKYPLPQVRQFHRSLTVELDEKNARLRTLVGGSYRQLLGTAETILHMRDDMEHVEEKLGRVGKGCGRAVIGGKASGLAKLNAGGRGGKKGEDLAWAARVKVLEMCAVAVGKLLREGGIAQAEERSGKGKNLVVAAKVLVLSRLLAKTVGDAAGKRSSGDQASLEALKKKIASLRRKLLRAIEKTAEKVDGDREDLIQALSAHSLATSSGAKDVIRHFLHIRGEAMALAFDDEEQKSGSPGVVRALELYTRTLLDVQALVPRRLSEALASLKTKPLLKDESIRNLEGLRLDVCEKWFGDEILFFTPYIRHDDLEGSQAVEMLRGWAKRASELMLEGLAKSLGQMADFKTVVAIRTRILEIWIKEGGKAKGFDPSILLDGLRKAVNDRMVSLVESRVSKLHLVATEIEGTLGVWREGVTDHQDSLWDSSLLEMDISNGASLFKQNILSRTHGRTDAVSRVFRGYQTWRHLVDEISVVVSQLSKQRWDDDLEDIEDDLSIESRNALLSTEDPKMLQEHLDSSLEEAYQVLNEKISALLTTYEESEQIGHISIYLLRVIRDIRKELPANISLQSFGLPLVKPLHQRLASEVSEKPLQAFSKTCTKKKVPGRALWEGTPELPVQPSPGTFKLLHSLALAMAKVGGDLWSPSAVAVLKRSLREAVSAKWNEALNSKPEVNGTPNDESPNDDQGPADSEEKASDAEIAVKAVAEKKNDDDDILIQTLFDILLLQNAFEIPDADADELMKLGGTVAKKVTLDAAAKKRVLDSAKEYWKRTALLFGLLA